MIVAPLLFRDRIAQRAKLEVNRNLDARVDWRDVGLSFFRSFPHLTFTLDDLTTVGTGRFENDTLASIGHLRVVLDLASVLGNAMSGKPLVVRAIELDRPRLSLIRLEDGSANWDITKKSAAQPEPEASKPLAVSLRSFEISDAYVALDDRQAKLEGVDRRFRRDSERRLQPESGCDSNPSTRRHRKRSLRWHSVPQSRRTRSRCRRRGRSPQEALHAEGHEAIAQQTRARSIGNGRLRRTAARSRPCVQGARHRLPEHSLSRPGDLRARLRQGEDLGNLRHRRQGEGRVRTRRLPVLCDQHEGERRHVPIRRPPASGTLDLCGSLAWQSWRKRRQHRREARPISHRARSEPDRRPHAAAHSDFRSRRRRAHHWQGRPCRPSPHHQARGDRPARRHHRLGMRQCGRGYRTSARGSTTRLSPAAPWTLQTSR